jgi:hypothetical protein
MRRITCSIQFVSIIIAALLLTLCLVSGFSSAQQGGIGVDNDGPSYIDIALVETDTLNYVNVEVRDLNGWNDIFSINVTITGNQNEIISQICYMQYPKLGSTTVAAIKWNQTVGDYLVESLCSWVPIPVAPWNPDNAVMEIGLRVSFALQKFSGQNVNILAMDKGQLTCEYNGPFSAEYTPAPTFDSVAVPIGLSAIVAVLTAVFVVYRRFNNNKLARAVEASHAASGED